MRPQIYRQGVIPIIGRDFLRRMALIVGSVVHQHINSPMRGHHLLNRILQCSQIGKVAMQVRRRLQAFASYRLDQVMGVLVVDIEKGYSATLTRKVSDQRGAYAAGSSGDQNTPALQAGIAGELASLIVGIRHVLVPLSWAFPTAPIPLQPLHLENLNASA